MKILLKQANHKFIAVIVILVFVFSFSLSQAEETTVLIETPAPSTSSEQAAVTIIESEPRIESTESAEVVAPEEFLTVGPTENLTPQVMAAPEPIIFDFSQPAETGTPETSGNVNETAASGNPILRQVLTGMIRDANLKGLTILAQWQMLNEKVDGSYLGADESALSGAQFLPSGQFAIEKPVAVCALVADAGGPANLNNISATINYPEAIAKAISQAGEKSGCGQLKNQFSLEKLDPLDAVALVCDKLRNNNNNLLAWGSDKIDNLVYSYEHLCGQDGLLARQAAELYCAQTQLSYDDPAGDYLVKVRARNNSGAAVTGENYLEYLELTTFENDFSEIFYGQVKLNELKILAGDLSWGESTNPTFRNTGNTRAQIKIWQNDFGLGKTDNFWNLEYQAKIGDRANFISYPPEQTTALAESVDLGKTLNVDFSVLVKKFPSEKSSYGGQMTLSADKAANLTCE